MATLTLVDTASARFSVSMVRESASMSGCETSAHSTSTMPLAPVPNTSASSASHVVSKGSSACDQ